MTEVIAVESNGSYIDLPTPSYQGYKGVWQELVNADRNVEGNMIKKRVNTKYTLTVEWKGLTAQQKNLIISLTNANSFGIRFFDMMDNTYKYISASAGGVYRGSDLDISGYGLFQDDSFEYYDVKMSLIEL